MISAAEHVYRIFLGIRAVHQRHGQGGSLYGGEAIAKPGEHNEGFAAAAKADVVHGVVLQVDGTVLGVHEHGLTPFSESGPLRLLYSITYWLHADTALL